MSSHLRKFGFGALAAGTVAAALVVPQLAGLADGWTPVTRGLSAAPGAILPATVSAAHPVTVVSTALDAQGRPVVTTRTSTDATTAAGMIRAGQKAPRAVAVELDAPTSALAVPTGTDPDRSLQYGLDTVRAGAAWTASTGTGVTVAVLDTGVDAAHADLAGQVLPGYNAIDDTTGTSSDGKGHGTHVAGIIAAVTGNGIGVAGTAPDARILPVQVMDATGSGTMSTLAAGIVWAADHGASVLNMSLGATTQVTAVTDAILYARSKGITVVAAAGNQRASGSPVSYPAADPGVIAVAATDQNDAYASFSNGGSYVDVAAPGVRIASTWNDGGYMYSSGTSMASPFVAAAAALIDAAHPGLTPDQVEHALESTAVDLGTAGRDDDYGYGRIDAAAAVAAAGTATGSPATTPPTEATTTPATPTSSPTTSPTAQPTTSPTPEPTATSTPTQAPTPAKVTPVITSDGQDQTVFYGTTVSVTFSVRVGDAPSTGRLVQLCTATGASRTYGCKAVTTSTAGSVVLRGTATGSYRVKLIIPATATSDAVTSPAYAVTVQALARLAVRNSTSLTATVTGAAGQQVQVQRQTGRTTSAWTVFRTYAAVLAATVAGVSHGCRYRLVVASTATVNGYTTGAVTP